MGTKATLQFNKKFRLILVKIFCEIFKLTKFKAINLNYLKEIQNKNVLKNLFG